MKGMVCMMKNKELSELIQNNRNADREMIEEMRAALKLETEKPLEKRDFDYIEQLSESLARATVPEAVREDAIQSGIKAVLRKNAEKKPMIRRKWLGAVSAACACLVLLIGGNAWAIHATGSNLFQLTYSFFTDHFEFQYSSIHEGSSGIVSQSDASDPYGIRTVCEQHGFTPHTPAYLPDGVTLTETNLQERKKSTFLQFFYAKGSSHISLVYQNFSDDTDLSDRTFGIPSDYQNVSELELDGNTVVISKEDQQYTAFFMIGSTVYTLYTDNLDYTESEHILRSMFR